MGARVIGAYPTIQRKRTGLFSLDVALADHKEGILGLPLRTITEIFGYTNIGKSTLAYYLSAKIAENGQVTICDVENADPDYVQGVFDRNGFNGDVWIIETTIPEKEEIKLTRIEGRKTIKVGMPRYHEEMMMDMVKSLTDEKVGAVILDSVGAVQSLEEQSGDFGEAFWGKRAKLVGQMSRATAAAVRNKVRPSCAFVINHAMGVMGGGKGHTTPGGDVLKYLAAVRMMLYPEMTWREKADDNDSDVLGFQVSGQVEKLRYGGRGRKFSFYIVPGYGVHQGVSAMFDCFEYGLAEQGTTVKLNGKSVGYIRKDLLSYAQKGKNLKFEPFQEAIEKYEKTMFKELSKKEAKDVSKNKDE